jgi:hypothetical protein
MYEDVDLAPYALRTNINTHDYESLNFHKRRGVYCKAERLPASQEGLLMLSIVLGR